MHLHAPSLVYDATQHYDYVSLLCSMGFDSHQMYGIIRYTNYTVYTCSNSESFQLNYPSFITFFTRKDHCIKKARVLHPNDWKVEVSPEIMFKNTFEKNFNYSYGRVLIASSAFFW